MTDASLAPKAKTPRILLTDEEKKRRKSESDRRYRQQNPLDAAGKAAMAERVRRWRETKRERANELSRGYYHANKEKASASHARWRERNLDRRREYMADWAKRNKDHVTAARRARYEAKRDFLLAQATRWKTANRSHVLAYAKAYRLGNPEKVRVFKMNRRLREKNGPGLSRDLATRLMRLQRGHCACCSVNLRQSGYHLDHIEPLARGGKNEDGNIQLLCPPCNRSKYSRLPHEFMRLRGFLL